MEFNPETPRASNKTTDRLTLSDEELRSVVADCHTPYETMGVLVAIQDFYTQDTLDRFTQALGGSL